ncbi:hypothetical protein [Phenylobacterium sp.]|uniref:hypothetical protein n=1 Tax=Phenylobacterium sp. TaxID=1871053 RepID=UPI0035B3DC95
MRLVSDNSDADLAAGRARQELRRALRAVAANILRIVRGAGKPAELADQLDELQLAISAFQGVTGLPPTAEFSGMLELEEDRDVIRGLNGRNLREHLAVKQMVRGALQKAASNLAGQLTQERAGGTELFEGAIALEQVRDEWRRESGAGKGRPRPRK